MRNPWIQKSLVLAAFVASPSISLAAGTTLGGFRVNGVAPRPAGDAEVGLQPNYPVAGFIPSLALTLTNQQSSDDFVWSAIPDFGPTGTTIPTIGGATIIFATLDSGGQTHLLSGDLFPEAHLASFNRAGSFTATILGAGGNQVQAMVTDPLGIYTAPVGSFNGGTVTAGAWRGHYNAAILTTPPGLALPNVVGQPLYGQYQVEIKNSQTFRRTHNGVTVRSPNISLLPMNSSINTSAYPIRTTLDLIDPLSSATSQPTFIPSFVNLNNFLDDPQTPTFWTFPFANTTVTHSLGTISAQQFLFDTGAQVTVLSEQLAADIGFDVETDTPDFTVQVSGIGGIVDVPGFVMQKLRLSSIGGTLEFNNVPVVVLDVVDPRDGVGFVPGIIGMNLFNDRDLVINQSTSNPIVRFSNPFTPQWNVNASGTWSPDANWLGGVPAGQDIPANFLGAITTPRTVTVDADYTIGSLKFDNANSYTLAGTGKLTLDTYLGPQQISVLSGSHTISARLGLGTQTVASIAAGSQLNITGDSTSPTGSLRMLGPGTLALQHARMKNLDIAGGIVRIITGGGTASTGRVQSLLLSGGTLDLADSKMIVDYTGASPLASLRAAIISGAITSNLLSPGRAVGYAEANDVLTGLPTSWHGQTADGTSVLLRMTLAGDADLTGTVNIADFARLASNFNQASFWSTGDFNHDGVTNISDFSLLASNFNQSLPADAARPAGDATVPEPGTAALLLVALMNGDRRRRR